MPIVGLPRILGLMSEKLATRVEANPAVSAEKALGLGLKRQKDFLEGAWPVMNADSLEPQELEKLIATIPVAIRHYAGNFHHATQKHLDMHLARLEKWFGGQSAAQMAEEEQVHKSHISTWQLRFTKKVGQAVSRKNLVSLSNGESPPQPIKNPVSGVGAVAMNGSSFSQPEIIDTYEEEREGKIYVVKVLASVSSQRARIMNGLHTLDSEDEGLYLGKSPLGGASSQL